MTNYFNELYNLWLLTNLLKLKGTQYLNYFINGNTYEVDRVNDKQETILVHIYNHISNLVSEPTHIIDNIYLGSAYNASSQETLYKYGIEKILNVTKEIPCMYPDEFEYKCIYVRDTRDSFLGQYLEEAYQFITENDSKQVFIHCYMGSSRSATIVIYYLMRKHLMSYQEAVEYVIEKRECVNLNVNFAQELKYLNNGITYIS